MKFFCVLVLKKALCGLKQAPRAWYSCIEAYFLKAGFTKCPYEHTLIVKSGDKGKMLIVCLYVDDLIFSGNCNVLFKDFKKSMMDEFEMTDLGMMHYFLGIKVNQIDGGIFICQNTLCRVSLQLNTSNYQQFVCKVCCQPSFLQDPCEVLN